MSSSVNLLLAYSVAIKLPQAAGKGLYPRVLRGWDPWPGSAVPGAAQTWGKKVALPEGAWDLVVHLPRQVQNQ